MLPRQLNTSPVIPSARIVFFALLIATCWTAHAQTIFIDNNGATAGFGWVNGTNATWNADSTSIWTSSTAGTNATVTWNAIGGNSSTVVGLNGTVSTSTVTVVGNFTVAGITKRGATTGITINGTNSLTFAPNAAIILGGSGYLTFGDKSPIGDFSVSGSDANNNLRLHSTYTGNITVGSNATLQFNTNSVFKSIPTANIRLIGSGTLQATSPGSSLAIGNLSGNSTTALVTLLGPFEVIQGKDETFSGILSGTRIQSVATVGTESNFTKNGSATLALTGNNTYVGATVVSAGTLSIATIADAGIRLTGNYVSNNAVVTANSTAGLSVNMTVASTTATVRQRINSINGTASTFTMSGVANSAGTNVVTLVGFANGLGLSDSTATNLQIGNATLRYTGTTASTDRNFTLINGTTAGIDVSQAGTTLTMSGSAVATTGGLNKLGNGTLLFSGNHSYTGATTISAGTLSIANIADGGTASGLGNSTSAVANLVFNGGTLSYTGGTASSNRNFTLASSTSSGIRVDNGATVLTLSGTSAAASGNLAKLGDGTLVFSGNHSYTGSTTISAGTLQIGAGGASGSIESTSGVSNNATLVFNRSDSTGFSKAISGTGNLTQAGSGTLTLTGANSYSGNTLVSAGTLAVGSGGSLGTSAVEIASGGVLNFTRSDSFTAANNIAGSGLLRQSGEGVLTLSGSNTNTGVVEATAGTILFSGANALSAGVGSLNATGGSTLSFADGTARTSTLSSGNLSLSSSNIVFDIGTTADQLSLSSGSASLTSSTVKLNFLEQIASAQSWTLLTAAGGLSGAWTLDQTFTGAAQSGSYIFSLTSNATSLTLVATANSNNAYWKGASSGDWSAASNWTSDAGGSTPLGSVPGSAADVIFTASGASNLGTTLGQDFTMNKVTISEEGVSIAAGNTLTANATASSAFSISAPGATIINANLAGAGAGLLKSGNGTLTLGGTNTYAGGTTLTGGTLRISSDASLGASSGTLTMNPGEGGTVTLMANGTISTNASRSITLSSGTARIDTDSHDLTLAGVVGGSGLLVKVGTGTLTLAGSNTYINPTTISGGTLALSGGAAIVDSGTIILDNTAGAELSILSSETIASLQGGGASGGNTRIASGQTLTIAEAGTAIYAGAIVNNGTLTHSGAGSLSANGQISGSGSVSLTGAGILSLAGNNSFSGGITLDAGTLVANQANALGSTGTISFGGGTLQYGTGISSDISSRIGMGAGQALRIDTNGNTVTYASAIAGSGGNLTKLGAGTLSLAGNNTFNGTISIAAGTLQIASGGLLGGGAFSQNISNASTFDYAGTGNQTLSGVISGSGGVLVSGGGLLNLTGNSTYTGATTLSSGALRINGNSTLSSNTTISVSSGATLQLAGNTTISNTITLTGNGSNGSGALRNISGDNRVVPNISLLGDTTLQADAGVFSTTNALNGNNTNLTLIGSGRFQINAANLGTGSLTINMTGANIAQVGITQGNSYSGDTIIQSGEFRLARANAIPTASNVVISGGTLNIQTSLQTSANVTLVSGNITGTTGALTATNGFILQNGTVSAVLAGNSTVTKTGVGTVTLSGNNTYTGGTALNAGTLIIGNINALGSSSLAQSSIASLLKIDTTGTIANNLSVFNVQASQNATLSGAITVNNASWEVDAGDTLTVSGVVSGSGGVTKNGTGTLILSGNNSFTGATAVNSGTLRASATGALGSTSSVAVNGGSLLVTAENAINNSADITLGGGTLAVSGTSNQSVGLLTLSADSIIDLNGFTGTLRFGGVGSWASSTNLAIWNWNGINQYETPVGDGLNTRHVVFTDSSGLSSYLNRISFYSDNGSSFAGNGFEVGFSGGGTEIIAVPEPETFATAVILLLAGALVQWIRRKQRTQE